MDRLYFMHPINTYGTPLEKRCLGIIRARLPGWDIENPNTEAHDAGYRRYAAMEGKIGMDYFTEVVLPGMGGGVFLAFRDGMVGAGIWKEVDWLNERRLPVWEILPASGSIHLVGDIPEGRRLDVQGTRERIRDPETRERRPY